MFADALEIATEYTQPVVLSRLHHNGQCKASIGGFVVVNPLGWIVTAAQILQEQLGHDRSAATARKHDADRAAIEADTGISSGERRKKLVQLGKPNPKGINRYSAVWGWPDIKIRDISFIGGVDIGIARLEPFDPSWITVYPKFKDPSKGVRPGKSLCRLGYPFHSFTPSYDGAIDRFIFPPEALPVPIFASEGIIARFIEITVTDWSRRLPFRLDGLKLHPPV